jgi:lysophospholipase
MTQAPFLSLPPGGRTPDDVWWIEASDGVRLRAALWRAGSPRALVVLLSGRTEYLEKMATPAAELVDRGYSVVSVDWRGQGLSDHLASPRLKGHVGDFAEFQTDLDALLGESRLAEVPGPKVLIAHSMGGAIGAGALARSGLSVQFDAAVLSAPMFGISMGRLMRGVAWATIRIARLFGKSDAWPPFGDMKTPYVLSETGDNVLTHDMAFWAWMKETLLAHPDLGLAMPTLSWFDASTREMHRLEAVTAFRCPVLCLLGTQESVVDPDAIRRTAARTGAQIVEIEGGLHELLIEAEPYRSAAWAAIDQFFSQNGLPNRSGG